MSPIIAWDKVDLWGYYELFKLVNRLIFLGTGIEAVNKLSNISYQLSTIWLNEC